jgi:hypothetical protein
MHCAMRLEQPFVFRPAPSAPCMEGIVAASTYGRLTDREQSGTHETQRGGARPGAARQYELFGCGDGRANLGATLGRRYRIRRYRMNADVGALWADVELACVTD